MGLPTIANPSNRDVKQQRSNSIILGPSTITKTRKRGAVMLGLSTITKTRNRGARHGSSINVYQYLQQRYEATEGQVNNGGFNNYCDRVCIMVINNDLVMYTVSIFQ